MFYSIDITARLAGQLENGRNAVWWSFCRRNQAEETNYTISYNIMLLLFLKIYERNIKKLVSSSGVIIAL